MQATTLAEWPAVLAAPGPGAGQAPAVSYAGSGRDVLLQGFHWHAHAGAPGNVGPGRKRWYQVIREKAAAIQDAGFTWVWLPPPSDSLAPQGYIPRRWHVLDSAYGAESELREAIRALHPVKALADVVLNHRVGVATAGADFADPAFADNRAAIVSDDESGVGTGAPDTGERHPAGRDLDHSNPGVRAAVKGYLRLLREAGFRGWRYDLVKGYAGPFVGEYNDATAPDLSVGEFFDGDRQKVFGWMNATGWRSAAFDFPLRYLLYAAIRHDDYGRLRPARGDRPGLPGLVGLCPAAAITFLDNHDTEHCREAEHGYEAEGTRHFAGHMVDMGYAYLLTHPGIPCVFWSHYFSWGRPTRQRIDALLRLRRSAGLDARSDVDVREARRGLYAAVIDGKVAVKLGSRDWWPGPGWRLAVDGMHLAVWSRGA